MGNHAPLLPGVRRRVSVSPLAGTDSTRSCVDQKMAEGSNSTAAPSTSSAPFLPPSLMAAAAVGGGGEALGGAAAGPSAGSSASLPAEAQAQAQAQAPLETATTSEAGITPTTAITETSPSAPTGRVTRSGNAQSGSNGNGHSNASGSSSSSSATNNESSTGLESIDSIVTAIQSIASSVGSSDPVTAYTLISQSLLPALATLEKDGLQGGVPASMVFQSAMSGNRDPLLVLMEQPYLTGNGVGFLFILQVPIALSMRV